MGDEENTNLALASKIYAPKSQDTSIFMLWHKLGESFNIGDLDEDIMIRRINHPRHIINILEKHFVGGDEERALYYNIREKRIAFIIGSDITNVEEKEVKTYVYELT